MSEPRLPPIPVLDGVATIERCLGPVGALRPLVVEHYVLDRGSTDATVAVLERRAASTGGACASPASPAAQILHRGEVFGPVHQYAKTVFNRWRLLRGKSR